MTKHNFVLYKLIIQIIVEFKITRFLKLLTGIIKFSHDEKYNLYFITCKLWINNGAKQDDCHGARRADWL